MDVSDRHNEEADPVRGKSAAADRRRPHAARRGRGGPSMCQTVTDEEAVMPVGEIFLYGIWAVLALGAIIASAMAFRQH